jgi:hypothetical protein
MIGKHQLLVTLLTAVVSVSSDVSAIADPPQQVKRDAPPKRDPHIQRAIDRGVAFLRSVQSPDGAWVYFAYNRTAPTNVGATALAGLSLLESGVKTDDPAVRKAADFLRQQAPSLRHTYSLSASIWFFDRLGDKADEPLIETMTARLLAGQNSSGGWTYDCPPPGGEEERRLINVIRQQQAKQDNAPPAKPGEEKKANPAQAPPKAGQPAAIPELLKQFGLPQGMPAPPQAGMPPAAAAPGAAAPQGLVWGGDNSNTQFASLALWVARRHKLPVDAALARIDERFRKSQLANGTWNYSGNSFSITSPAMTCAGLTGLAVAHGAAAKPQGAQAPDKNNAKVIDPDKDQNMLAGFRYLGAWLQESSQVGTIGMSGHRSFYFLWSLERIGEIYGLKTIGRVEWYPWGANLLINSQLADGGWGTVLGVDERSVDTAFALLFLARSNVAKDLSVTLRGKLRDPGMHTLRAGGGGVDVIKNKGDKIAEAPDKKEEDGDARKLVDPKEKLTSPPANNGDAKGDSKNEESTTARQMSEELAAAKGTQQEELLAKYKEGKGSAYTMALAGAIARLSGDSKNKTRDALAERLTRMTAATLRAELKDDDPEIRRAASLACAMKDDKSHMPDLIPLLDDPEPLVNRAAHAALKSLSNQDFGPAKDASVKERARAVEAWKAWWEKQSQK